MFELNSYKVRRWRRGIDFIGVIVPTDVHMHRISRELGLTRRKVADIVTAQEISVGFRDFSSEDPCRFDFCLTRLNMLLYFYNIGLVERSIYLCNLEYSQ